MNERINKKMDDFEFWSSIERSEPLETIKKIEDLAKQIITLTSTLSTIYFGILTLNNTSKQTSLEGFLLLLPIIFWILSLSLSVWTLLPKRFTPSAEGLFDTYVKIRWYKIYNLRKSLIFLALSLIALLFSSIIIRNNSLSISTPTPVYVIIITELPTQLSTPSPNPPTFTPTSSNKIIETQTFEFSITTSP
jgi:hypothetical protein